MVTAGGCHVGCVTGFKIVEIERFLMKEGAKATVKGPVGWRDCCEFLSKPSTIATKYTIG